MIDIAKLRRTGLACCIPFASMLAGCDGAGDAHLISPGGEGHLEGVTFLDLSRDGRMGSGESPLGGIRVGLVPRGSQDTIRSTVSDDEGQFRFESVPAGTYEVGVSEGPVGDSLVLSDTDPSPVEVSPGGTRSVSVGVSFPAYAPRQLASLPEGARVYVEGIGLNPPGAIGDAAVHVWDGERAVRALGVGGFSMSAGDSVRILGRVGRRSGRVVLTSGTGFRIAERPPPDPIEVTVSQAANAGQGQLDAALVRVTEVQVHSAASAQGGHLLVVSDGTGSLRVRVASGHLAEAGLPALQPGAALSVTGVLVPRDGDPGWELRTRGGADLSPEAGGTITGITFYDENGDGELDDAEPPLAGVRLSLYRESGAGGAVATLESDGAGAFTSGEVPAGAYRIEVDGSTIPDTMVVRRVAPEVVAVPIGDTARVTIAITHPSVTVEEARLTAQERTVFVQGTALNATQTFGNRSIHLRGSGRAIRMLNVQGTSLNTGAQVRVRARTGRSLGQPVLTSVVVLESSGGGSPARIELTSGDAASARGGELDANLVQLPTVTVVSSSYASGVRTVRVDDGSGVVEVSVRLATVGMTESEAQQIFGPGRTIGVSGVLIAVDGEDRWRLHPRARSDVVTNP